MPPRSLEELLAPTAADEFLQRYWGQQFVHLSGQAERLRDLLPWYELNRILAQHRLEPPRLRLEKHGASPEELSFVRYFDTRRGTRIPRVDAEALYAHLRDGATLILDAVDELHSPITVLCESLSRVFGVHVQTNLYAAWGTSHGFHTHWDDHDVIILQLAGRKDWRIYGTTRKFPLYRDTDPTLEKPEQSIWEATISAGDLLYIPRGWWHDALAIGEPSLHLTLGINNNTGIDLLLWLTDQSRDLVDFREDLPRFAGIAERQLHAKRLRRTLMRLFADDAIDRFFESHDAGLRPRPRYWLPKAAQATPRIGGDSERLWYAGPSTAPLVAEPKTKTFVFRALGKEWRFSDRARSVVEILLLGEPVTLEELHAQDRVGLTKNEIHEFCERLLEEGLLSPAPSDA